MMIKYRTSSHDNTCHNVTLVPRLEYSEVLLAGIIRDLRAHKASVKSLNKKMLVSENNTILCSIKLERTLAFSLETLLQVRQKIRSIAGVASIPRLLPPAIPAVRVISAQIHSTMPECSKKLCELSVHLGSIVLDSASLSTAKFDFSRSNHESSIFLDKVKLIVDSKINKQYGNLDSFKQKTA